MNLPQRNCKQCGDPFTPRNSKQEFCVGKGCRQQWHRAHNGNLHGIIYGIYQRPGGGWSVVAHFNELPAGLRRGQAVISMETIEEQL